MSDEAKPRKKNYVPTPEVPKEVQAKLFAILSVLTQEVSEVDAARQLGVSRPYFQTLKNRALKALVEELEPKQAGRPAKPAEVASLQEEVRRLRKENAALQERVATIDRLLGVASDLMNGRVKLAGRQKGGTPAKKSPGATGESEEPDGVPRFLEGARALIALGLQRPLVAAVLGVGESTLRRWLAQVRRKEAARPAATSVDLHTEALVENEVRRFRGLVGEEALRKLCGVSRRQARRIKAETMTRLEVERQRRARRIHISMPGLVRGFDAMHVDTADGRRYLLVGGDAALPYRTSVSQVRHYDGETVARVLDEDFTRHGPPLFLRLDRAACHTTPEVLSVLRRHGVVLLQGPPRHPGYYGQLERQNRELRAWLERCGLLTSEELNEEIPRMLRAWNSRLPRRRLSWRSAEAVWDERPALEVDRSALRREVVDRARRLQEELSGDAPKGLAERLAVEATLKQRGWMREEPGGWC